MKVRGGAVPDGRGGGSRSRPGRTLGEVASRAAGTGARQGREGEARPRRGRVLPPFRAARRPVGAEKGRFPPFASRAAAVGRPACSLSSEEKATAAARSICPVHPPGTGMAGERSLAHQGARQPVSLIPWSLCRRDGDRLDSALLKELRDSLARVREKAGKLQSFMFKRDSS